MAVSDPLDRRPTRVSPTPVAPPFPHGPRLPPQTAAEPSLHGVERSRIAARPTRVHLDTWKLSLAGLSLFSFAVRLLFAGDQSAYMDEGTNVLTGRMLVEQHAVYAEVLKWAYGSYLWPLIAGAADTAGGLLMVRAVTACLGVISVLATALVAARLTPTSISASRRKGVALLAGAIMAVAPSAIAAGRFGTYDALAGAGFMLGVALLLPGTASYRRATLLAAGVCLFVAFLSKYLVAVYFPFICVYMVVAPLVQPQRHWRLAVRHLVWFVVPLTAACAAYLVMFLGPLLTLLTFSLGYNDLKSSDPLAIYVWDRLDLWLLAGVAVLGWRRATATGRVVALAGLAVVLGFQAEARADFDFWKHSIYVLFFLAPLASLTWLKVPLNTGTWRVVAVAGAGCAVLWLTPQAENNAQQLVGYYPNLGPSLAAVNTYTQNAPEVLMDDTALRYYLYGSKPMDAMVGPFSFDYQGLQGAEAYRRAVNDRWFGAIVLDGGVSPQATAMDQQIAPDLAQNYTRVFTGDAGNGYTVSIYTPSAPLAGSSMTDSAGPWPIRYTFDDGTQGWGAHPENSHVQPGQQVTTVMDPSVDSHPSLQFAVADQASTLGVLHSGSVRALRAQVYVQTSGGSTEPVRIGFVAFDQQWRWHDDGFRYLVTPGKWTAITWTLPDPGQYVELGLTFPANVQVADIGDFEIAPSN